MSNGKTSTFTIHHDRCDPGKWTVTEWKLLADFVKYKDRRYAAGLSKLGMQLVISDHHVPTGGTLEHAGFAQPSETEFSDDLADIAGDEDITPIVQIYRGPVQYAVRYGTGDGEGNFEGWEYEVKASQAEADEYLKSIEESSRETETVGD
jgi:hypothetical protein